MQQKQQSTRAQAQPERRRATSAAHDTKRLEIIERCAQLFDAGGYHRATMQLLADEVGLGKPTLYHYFASKTDILYAIHQIQIAALLGGIDSAQRRNLTPQQQLYHAARDILEQIAQHPGYVRAFFEHYGELETAKRAEIRARRNEYFQRVCDIIRAGMASGVFRKLDVEIAAYGFLGTCSWAYQWYRMVAGKQSAHSVADALCKNFLLGLEKRVARGARAAARRRGSAVVGQAIRS
jgi:AcrR family transcriptional regulator